MVYEPWIRCRETKQAGRDSSLKSSLRILIAVLSLLITLIGAAILSIGLFNFLSLGPFPHWLLPVVLALATYGWLFELAWLFRIFNLDPTTKAVEVELSPHTVAIKTPGRRKIEYANSDLSLVAFTENKFVIQNAFGKVFEVPQFVDLDESGHVIELEDFSGDLELVLEGGVVKLLLKPEEPSSDPNAIDLNTYQA